MDRRQNNGGVKALSPRHCPATCALRNCSFNCCAGQSLRQCPLHRCWRTTWTTRSKRRPTCSAQLRLPTHDLFWAKLRVQLHLPPLRSLDFLISPGTPCWMHTNYGQFYFPPLPPIPTPPIRPFCLFVTTQPPSPRLFLPKFSLSLSVSVSPPPPQPNTFSVSLSLCLSLRYASSHSYEFWTSSGWCHKFLV